MHNILKKSAVLIAIATLLTIVAACGNGEAPATTPEQPTAPAQQQPASGSGEQPTAPAQQPASGASEQPTQPPAMPGEPFRIGAMDALTGVGESYGNPILQSKQLAVEEINAAGGVNGRMLELIAEDSKCAAQDAITAYNKLTDVDGVKIILGTTCSGAMLGAAPRAEADGVIMLSASATSPDIAGAGDYIFRTAINDDQLGVDTGNALHADGHHHLATITEATDYAEGARRTTVARFEELGGHVVAAESYTSDVTDFRSQLTKLIGAKPDAIHLAAQGEASGGTIIKQLRELGYEGPIYTESVAVAPDSLSIAGESATGMKAIIPNPDLDTDAGKKFLANFEARYDYGATLPWFQASAYDDVYIAAECLRQTGDDQDADAFRDCLYGLTWSGAIGDNYGFDANGDVAGLGNVVVEVLPVADRDDDNLGYVVLGQAPGADTVTAAAVAMAPQEPFRIGAMDALTGVGESYGNPILQSKQLAVEEINAAGGVNGRMLELIAEDSKCAAQDAITAYNKLTDVDGVKIILGTTCSGAMLGAAPRAEADGVIMLSASATSPDIAGAGDYIFRTAINDDQLGVDTGNALHADGHHHLATITEATDYAEGARRTTVARFEELGGHVVAAESYTSDVTDFRSQLTKLIGAKPDAIHLAAQGEASGGTIIKQLRELGYEGPIYTESVAVAPDSLSIAGESATGMKAIIPNPDLDTDAGKKFLANFEARYDYGATLPWFQASAYDDVYIAAECLRQTGDDQDADAFRDCLYGLTWSGAIGDNYGFDANGDVAGLGNVVVEVLPVADRDDDNLGYVVLGQAPTP